MAKGQYDVSFSMDEETPLLHRHPLHHSVDDHDTKSNLPSSATASHTRSLARSISWENYVTLVEKYPLLVKSITAMIILSSADMIAQCFEYWLGTKSVDGLDWPRTGRFAAIALFGAPWSHFYFHWLDHFLPPTPEPWTKTTAVKVMIDQFIQAPLLLAVMIIAISFMKGEGFLGAKVAMGQTFMPALIANWKLWLPASAINIAFVKPSLRVLYVNVVFFLWTIILSLILNGKN